MEKQEQANAVQLPMTPEATSAVLAVRYAVDAEFRAAFDKDPKAALAEIGGQELPSDLKIVVHRNEDKCWHVSLPSAETAGALGDQDIANVSGGTGGMADAEAAATLLATAPLLCSGLCGSLTGIIPVAVGGLGLAGAAVAAAATAGTAAQGG